MKNIEIRFWGVDRFNRPIFRAKNGDCYGSVDKLFSYDAEADEVLEHVTEDDLCYFGRKPGCEPEGLQPSKPLKIVR